MKTVLHITPHLGGGVGTVLLGYLESVHSDPDFRHRVTCLDYANDRAIASSKAIGFSLADKMSLNVPGLLDAIATADIVLIHWWNHPLLYALLVRETLPPARVIFWSHVSGFHPPYVFPEPALDYPDLFVFTTPISFDVPEVRTLPERNRRAMRAIWSTGGVARCTTIRPSPHSGFKIGYIGTVDYCKLHPRFLEMCSKIAIPDAQFVVCGGPSEERIRTESSRYAGQERLVFTGLVDDIRGYLSEFDVFGYPLAPHHYGTCEQSLAESMAAGVPPVVLSNGTERHMVKDGETGIVAADTAAYVRAIERLYRDPALRRKLSANAREHAKRSFSVDLMADKWCEAFECALQAPKTPRRWTGRFGGKTAKPFQLFLESLGVHGRDFEATLSGSPTNGKTASLERIRQLASASPIWSSETRGTPKHYCSFFPEDQVLQFWSGTVALG